jgi:hypothetical protein
MQQNTQWGVDRTKTLSGSRVLFYQGNQRQQQQHRPLNRHGDAADSIALDGDPAMQLLSTILAVLFTQKSFQLDILQGTALLAAASTII